MAERKRGTPVTPALPTVLRPATSPYRQNTVHGEGDIAEARRDTPTDGPGSVQGAKRAAAGPGAAPEAGAAPAPSGAAAATGEPTDPPRPSPAPPRRRGLTASARRGPDPERHGLGPALKISTRIPMVPVLDARLSILMQDYEMTAREARPLMLRQLFTRLRQICETGEIPDLRFVRVPKDLTRIPTTLSIPREIFAAFSAQVDRHNALSRSAVLESVLFQLITHMERDGALP
ncbi:MAG: hypothetical protein AAFV19_22315 [Pseudomonadota bacterium]